jgi:wyosine [tRNA(Phe)-imidazoG37] synthetase (radical SAM superfamily)
MTEDKASRSEQSPSVVWPTADTAFGRPRNFLGNRYVYAVISQRAGGLSIGINLTPDKQCNFHCAYCEVDRSVPGTQSPINLRVLSAELGEMLKRVREHKMGELEWFRHVPDDLLELRELALSGDGEPTLCPQFTEVLEAVAYFRAKGIHDFKIVLITNTTGLNRPAVKQALRLLTSHDEIWAKLDAGTQEYMDRINAPDIRIEQVLANILELARQRPVVIQSLFPRLHRQDPPPDEIEAYARRLRELKRAGAQIDLVQVYSAHRPPHLPDCSHLSLRKLSHIARRVREVAGLRAEVF